MPDLTAPLLSLDASGTIAKTLTYAKWRGIKYARQRVVPANPRSVDQTKVRSTFSYLSAMYKYAPTAISQAYDLGSKGRPLTNRNLFAKTNEPTAYASATDLHILASPGTGGAPAPRSLSLTPHATTIDVSLQVSSLPPGWTLVAGWAVAWASANPTSALFIAPISSVTGANPSALTITGLAGTTLYRVSAYAEYTDASGQKQYTIATNATTTTL